MDIHTIQPSANLNGNFKDGRWMVLDGGNIYRNIISINTYRFYNLNSKKNCDKKKFCEKIKDGEWKLSKHHAQ